MRLRGHCDAETKRGEEQETLRTEVVMNKAIAALQSLTKAKYDSDFEDCEWLFCL